MPRPSRHSESGRTRGVERQRGPRAALTLARAGRRLARAVGAALLLAAAAGRSASAQICGTPGKDGPGGVLSGVVNTYYPGNASAAAGATSITLAAAVGSTTPIAAGDLLLVIQMQDATINVQNNANYGGAAGTGAGATSWGTAGRYEYVTATSALGVAGGTVSIRGTGTGNGLLYAYTNAAYSASAGQVRFQVVRVPQFSTATLGSGLTATGWNGRAGGILALDVAGVLTLGGSVSLNGKGFRGGAGRQLTGEAGGSATAYRDVATADYHGSKGEGSAGTPRYVWDGVSMTNTGVEGYVNGSTGRGAPANGGGGGTDANPDANDQNSGGGGGAGAGAGGLGGNSWNSNQPLGGRAAGGFPATPGKISLGGGGGAGTTNNGTGALANGLSSSGAPGGGIAILRVGSVTGTGSISANGLDADKSVLNDGSGGGGGGGSILVFSASGSLSGLSLSATGGDGGDNTPTGSDYHGPGGGGGGGYIATSGSPTSADVSPGVRGGTGSAKLAYGASNGGVVGVATLGLLASSFPGVDPASGCIPALTVTKTTSTATSVVGGTATYTIAVSNAAGVVDATQVAISDALPAGMSYASSTAPVLTGGATRTATVNPAVGATTPSFGTFTIPAGGRVTVTLVVNIALTASAGTYQNPATATYFDPARSTSTGTTSASYNPASSTGEDVVVAGKPDVTLTKSHTGNFVAGQPGVYTIAVRNAGSLATSATITVKDTLPTGLTFASAAGTGWTCAAATQVVTCTTTTVLAIGVSAGAITLTVNVLASGAPGVTNRAWVSTLGDLDASNNVSSDPTTVVVLAVSVTPDGGTVSRLPSNGTVYSQTFTVTNNGTSADNFSLAAAAGNARVILVSVNGAAGSTGSISLAAGGSTGVVVSYRVADTASAGSSAVLTLRATSVASASITDPGDLTIQVVRAALGMTKRLFRDDTVTLMTAADRATPGQYLQYRITVTGSGTADAVTVHVADTLPAEVAYDSARGDAAGWTFSAVNGVVSADLAGTLAAGATRYFWVRVRVR